MMRTTRHQHTSTRAAVNEQDWPLADWQVSGSVGRIAALPHSCAEAIAVDPLKLLSEICALVIAAVPTDWSGRTPYTKRRARSVVRESGSRKARGCLRPG